MTVDEMRAILAEHGNLRESVRSYEGQLIAASLEAHQGAVTPTARELGLKHQTLSFIIASRQKLLQNLRKPIKRRRQSIIKIHSQRSIHFRTPGGSAPDNQTTPT